MVVNQWPSNNQVETGLELRPHWLQASVLTSAVQSLLPHPFLKVNRKTSNRLSNGIQGFRLHIDHWCGIVRATRYKLKHFFVISLSCSRLGLSSLAYLWRRDQQELLSEMISSGVEAVLVKVAAMGI